MTKTQQLLPKEAYYQNEWFGKEKSQIFEKQWQFVAMAEELATEKSYKLTTIGNTPVIILNENGTLHAFLNICRHRGVQLIRGDEKLESTLQCPYHNWSYNLQGELKGIPQSKEFEGLDKSCMGLKKAQCEVWQGLVFVNLDLNASSLKNALAPIKNRILPYDNIGSLSFNDGYRYVINANWKIFVENYMDIYHLSHIHKESLKEYDHKNSHYEFVNNHWLFYQPLSETGDSSSKWWNLSMGQIDSFNGEKGAYVSMLFPNFGITATENLCLFVQIEALSPESTQITVYVKSNYGSKEYKLPMVYDYRRGTTPIQKLLEKPDVMNEDIYACEMIQRNLKSSHFEVGALAQNLERPLFEYQMILQKLMKNI